MDCCSHVAANIIDIFMVTTCSIWLMLEGWHVNDGLLYGISDMWHVIEELLQPCCCQHHGYGIFHDDHVCHFGQLEMFGCD